jgi:Tol biopolymer transport system component
MWVARVLSESRGFGGRARTQFHVGFELDWPPDGHLVGFIRNAEHPHAGDSANVGSIRPDGTGLRFLTHYDGGQVNAVLSSYSPDGRWIACRLEDHGRFGVYKMRPDGTAGA